MEVPRTNTGTGGGVYIPHPAPNAAGSDDGSKMGVLRFLKTLFIPAIVSLLLWFIVSYGVIPAWRQYRDRYSHYLPVDAISTHTTSFRQRVQDALVRYLVPSSWRQKFGRDRATASAQDGSGSDFDDEEGEELDDVDDHRREALSLDARRSRDDARRLSRDLEEGFKDDSDDEDDLYDDQRSRTLSR